MAENLHQLEKSGLNQEACCRSAISRAYFAAYCHARNYARDRNGLTLSNLSDDHGKVKAHFSKGKNAGVGPKLDQLRQWRNQADYDDNIGNLTKQLGAILGQAEKVFLTLK